MTTRFVHLGLHSEYSLADSVIRIKPLMTAARERGIPALALTDLGNLFAMVRFYRAALAAGIKPLVGADVWIDEGQESQPSLLRLLCMDRTGYRNICELLTMSYQAERRHGRPVIRRQALSDGYSDGLIALSAGIEGDIGRTLLGGREQDADRALKTWRSIFPDRFYVEVTRVGRPGEETYIAAAARLASAAKVPLVATNDVRFLDRDDFEAHEARVCIHQGHTLDDPGRPKPYTEEQYLKTPDEMTALFEDLPEALENSVEIARRCTLELTLGRSVLPDFPVPEGETPDSYLRQTAAAALEARLPELIDPGEPEPEAARAGYRDRLGTELDVICGMGFPGYFLIVADFIRWAREHGVPVGPGRGSGAGSLVAFVLGITDLDPLRYELLFERFLNPERVSMPDFDIDFCMDGRDRVIDYVASRYGRGSVSQIITFGTMAARAVVRDVGRVLGQPFGFVDRVAKLIPFEIGMTLGKALEQDEELRRVYDSEEEVRAIIDLARQLEGLARNAGKHAGGVVIAPGPLTEFTPLYFEEPGGSPVSQFDKDDVEAVGLVKFDFLGLRTLTIIDRAVERVNRLRAKEGHEPVDIARIPLDDPETFTLLKGCGTTAVFQLESRGMKDLIKRLQPDCFDDIVALVALFRPGPLQSGMVDDFISRKHGTNQEPIDYFHPSLESILTPTYGVILYQEQVMQIAQVLAGYTLGAADMLRRAMGKKKPEEMAKQRSIFVEGAEARGVEVGTATYIFDLMEKFAGYGFNKSHSAAYALLSYQTAWLKAHYPAAFMAAVLSADMDHTDKVVTLVDECDHMKLEVASPNVNESRYAFSVSGPDSLLYGLGAIKGVGQGAVQAIIEERERGGAFLDLMDFCSRIDLQKANRRVLEALIRAGALDGLGANRATLMHQLPLAIRRAEQHAQAEAAGQTDLFGMPAISDDGGEDHALPIETLPDWSDAERLAGEKETLGLYLTGHPIEAFAKDLSHMTSGPISEFVGAEPGSGAGYRRDVVVAGLVLQMRRRGNRVSLVLDDRSGRIEVTLFDDVYQSCRNVVATDAVLVVEGGLRYDDFIGDWRVTAKRVMDIDQAREQHASRLLICWNANGEESEFVDRLRGALQPFRQGRCPVSLMYMGDGARARIALGDEWQVRPTRELLQRLGKLVGGDNVRLVFGPRHAA
jgi:DNA polymerase-3 subunit alpha